MRRLVAGRRGAGAIEYAIMVFLVIVVGFLGWKFLGHKVKGSTEASEKSFEQGGKSGGAGGQQQAAGGGGGTAAAPAGGGGQDNSKVGTPGGAKVANVDTQGGGTPDPNKAGKAAKVAEEEETTQSRPWIKLAIIAVIVLMLMTAIFSFGRKGKKAASR